MWQAYTPRTHSATLCRSVVGTTGCVLQAAPSPSAGAGADGRQRAAGTAGAGSPRQSLRPPVPTVFGPFRGPSRLRHPRAVLAAGGADAPQRAVGQ